VHEDDRQRTWAPAHNQCCARCVIASLPRRPGTKPALPRHQDTLAELELKMPQLAIPLRVAVCGRTQTPSIDAVLACSIERSIERLSNALA
jgi:glutamyl/glutaminyl-tRNA synthetase